MKVRYIVISFIGKLNDGKLRKVGSLCKDYDTAVDVMAKNIAKSNHATLEEWESDTGGREEIRENGGEYWCLLPTRRINDYIDKHWKIFEIKV